MHDKNYEKNWEWTDKTCSDYTNWAKNEPNHNTVDEDCVAIYFRTKGNKWNDAPCTSFKAKSICKKPKEGAKLVAVKSDCTH